MDFALYLKMSRSFDQGEFVDQPSTLWVQHVLLGIQYLNYVIVMDVWRRMRDDVARAPWRGHVFTVWWPADSERIAGL